MFEGSDPKAELSRSAQIKFTIGTIAVLAVVIFLNYMSGWQHGNWSDQQQRSEISRTSTPL
jgi:hypothetical protein